MTLLLKLLPFAVAAFVIWRMLTARGRTTRALMERSRPLQDWSILEAVDVFARKLETPPFQVRILEMDQVNGVALPGGEIFISSGLYDRYLAGAVTRDEVASVIAHEIGHVALGHHQRRLTVWRSETAALAALGFILGRAIFGWAGLLAALGLGAFRNKLTQRDEFEADAFAAQLMMRSDLEANAVVRLLEKLHDWSGGRTPGPAFQWLSSHPPIPARIARARQVIDAGLPPE